MKLDKVLSKMAVWTPKKVTFPPTPRIVHEARSVAKKLRDIKGTVDLIDLRELRERLFQARDHGDWGSISRRDWRYVADCLNSGDPALVNDTVFLDEYLGRLKEQRSRRAISRLIRYYLNHFDPEHPGILKIAKYLNDAVMQWRWHWSEQRSIINLFDVSKAPASLVRYMMKSAESPTEAMDAVGLSGPLYGAKIACHGYLTAASGIRNYIINNPESSLPAIKRFVTWGLLNERFAFDRLSGVEAQMANALLLPWVERQPTEDCRNFIEAHLLSLLHDLRIDRARWMNVDEKAKMVMRRWLTKASLEQFLDVVDKTAQSHMWAARRKFWSAYYENKFMLEAWVAFAADGAKLARKLAYERDNPSIRNFGNLTKGNGVVRDHAVLIMQIGDLVVADWSHNGKCHVWLPYSESAPKLYKKSYGKRDLDNGSDFQKVHIGAWQTDVHDFIYRNTSIRMMTRDYM